MIILIFASRRRNSFPPRSSVITISFICKELISSVRETFPQFFLRFERNSWYFFSFFFPLSPSLYYYFSVVQLCPILCDPMDCSSPGFPVPHHLPKFAQVHVHGVSDAIQPSHPLTPSSSALNLSQHQGLFQWVSCTRQMTKILELQLKQQSFKGWFPLRLTHLISLLSKGLWRVFSSTTVQRHFSVILPIYLSISPQRYSLVPSQ